MNKTIGLTLLIVLFFVSCEKKKEGKEYADTFFNLLISKNYAAAAQCIDPKSPIYPNRQQFIRELASDTLIGQLNSIGGGIMAYSMTSSHAFSHSTWKFNEKLNYDSTSIRVDIKVIDRGNGPKIFELIRKN